MASEHLENKSFLIQTQSRKLFFFYDKFSNFIHITCIFIFLDIDECKNGEYSCHENALCSNTAGSYVCRCIRGFDGDGMTCVGNSSNC